MSPNRLLRLARRLAEGAHGTRPGRPNPVELQRAVSTIYYALFHALARCVADTLVAKTRAARSQPAWVQAYRAVNHGNVKTQCNKKQQIELFPSEIQTFARFLVEMQYHRHEADYDPTISFTRVQVIRWVNRADYAIKQFDQVANKDRQAFAVYVALPFHSSKSPRGRVKSL